ncbi:MAG TPA: hypothetical protein VNK46_12190 [Nitrospiraceae bacterium]|nr:hypothetical protein [Nitrospiraceae bacterium]
MSHRHQLLLLAVLCSTWAGLVVWRAAEWEEPAHVPLTNVSGTVSGQPAPTWRAGSGLHVNLDLLEASRSLRDATFATPRNIFSPPRADAAPPMNAVQPLPSEPDHGSPEALHQQAVSAELAQFRYLGYMQLGDTFRKREVALLVKQEEVHIVKAGETIEDRFLVKTITPDGVTLQETGSRVEQIVPLALEPEPQPPPSPQQ